MLIPFHPRWEHKCETRFYEVKLGVNTSATQNQKLHTLLYIFWSSAKTAVWATPADCGHIWGCLEVCSSLRAVCRVYVHVCVVRLGTKADTHHQRFAQGKRDPFIFVLAEAPVGTTCLSQARNPFVWFILKVSRSPAGRTWDTDPESPNRESGQPKQSLWGTDSSLPQGKDS